MVEVLEDKIWTILVQDWTKGMNVFTNLSTKIELTNNDVLM